MAKQQLATEAGCNVLQESALDYLQMAYAVALRLSGDRRQAELIARHTIEELIKDRHAASHDANLKMKVLRLVRANFLSTRGEALN